METANTKANHKSVKSTFSHSAESALSSWGSNSGGIWASYESKSPTRDNTKPREVKLRTQERATKRAMFNYTVAAKLSIIDQRRKQEEMLHKMIEDEEIRLLRKEMIPRAQLMPFFDRPFVPSRSTRPLTIPKEPSLSFTMMSSKCCNSLSGNPIYNFQQTT